jgi:hypothetical protein
MRNLLIYINIYFFEGPPGAQSVDLSHERHLLEKRFPMDGLPTRLYAMNLSEEGAMSPPFLPIGLGLW